MNKEDKIKEIEAKQRQLADELAELNKPELKPIRNGTVFKCAETYFTVTDNGYWGEMNGGIEFFDVITTEDVDAWRDDIYEEVGTFKEAYIRRSEVKEVVDSILAMKDTVDYGVEECAENYCAWEPTSYNTKRLVEKLKSLLS